MGRNYYDDDFDDDYDPTIRRGRGGRREHVDISDSKRMVAGMCGIFLGAFGVHKFILGYGVEGAVLLSMTLIGIALGTLGGITGFLCCLPFLLLAFFALPIITGIIGLVEGIIYINMSDEDFVEIYQMGRRGWF